MCPGHPQFVLPIPSTPANGEAALVALLLVLVLIAAILWRVQRQVSRIEWRTRPETYALMRWDDKKWTWTGRGRYVRAYGWAGGELFEKGWVFVSVDAAREAAQDMQADAPRDMGVIHIWSNKRGSVGWVAQRPPQTEYPAERAEDGSYVMVCRDLRLRLDKKLISIRLETTFSRISWNVREGLSGDERERVSITLRVHKAEIGGGKKDWDVLDEVDRCLGVLDNNAVRFLPLRYLWVESVADFSQDRADVARFRAQGTPRGDETPPPDLDPCPDPLPVGFLHVTHFLIPKYDAIGEETGRSSDVLDCCVVLSAERFATLRRACEAGRVGQVNVVARGAGLSTSGVWESAADLILPSESAARLRLESLEVTQGGPAPSATDGGNGH